MQKRLRDDSRNTAAWRQYDNAIREQTLKAWSHRDGLPRLLLILLIVAIVATLAWGSVAMVHVIDWLTKP